MLIVSTVQMARIFHELEPPMRPGETTSPPAPETPERFVETSERFGYGNTSPEENAKVGLLLPAA